MNRASKGITTLIVAHRLSTIKHVDRIFAINNGAVVESGTHDELMAEEGFYHKLVNSQVFADNVDEEIEELGHRRVRASNSVTSATSSNTGRTRLLSRNSVVADSSAENDLVKPKDAVSEKKRLLAELKEEGAEPQNLLQILKYARPEWLMILGGIISCIIGGSVFPVFSIFFSNILEVFAEPDPEEKRRRGHNWALMFLLLGVIQAACMLLHSIFFGTSAERLTKRLRSKLFQKIFSMEIGWFDEPSHTTGKLCTRLATDCPNIKSVIVDFTRCKMFKLFRQLTTDLEACFHVL